jgi:hypothetical protein
MLAAYRQIPACVSRSTTARSGPAQRRGPPAGPARESPHLSNMKRRTPRAPQPDPARSVKDAIAGRVVALFNDRARGEAPVVRRLDGMFGPKAVAWRVHGDVTSMMVGGISALLLQMLHPAVLAGVWDHSNFRTAMHGRLRRTARFIALTTYGGREEAEAVIARVRKIHDRVDGTLPDGTPYAAISFVVLAWPANKGRSWIIRIKRFQWYKIALGPPA